MTAAFAASSLAPCYRFPLLIAVVATLKELGIADTDIQTSNLSIWPQYSERGPEGGVSAYQAGNNVSVTIRNVAQAGDLLEHVIDAGANYLSGIVFTIAEPATAEATARDRAIADARTRAQAMSNAGGAQLGELLAMSETIGGGPTAMYHGAGQAATGAPVQPGKQTIVRQVQVTYALK